MNHKKGGGISKIKIVYQIKILNEIGLPVRHLQEDVKIRESHGKSVRLGDYETEEPEHSQT